MPLPAKVATVAITAGLTTFSTTTAVAAANSLMEFAEEQAANSAFNKDLPNEWAPSPEGNGMFSPLDGGWSFNFSLPKDRDPLGVLLICVLVFLLINFSLN
jgi:hypothetical protein